eukprot:GHVU01232053.1.p1 GENE.GHVU01232053.1~~GHVU01232053.1.p1  ORF type:complete len:160 (-),score=23.99 GHVU01232053.1:695-1174(-)
MKLRALYFLALFGLLKASAQPLASKEEHDKVIQFYLKNKRAFDAGTLVKENTPEQNRELLAEERRKARLNSENPRSVPDDYAPQTKDEALKTYKEMQDLGLYIPIGSTTYFGKKRSHNEKKRKENSAKRQARIQRRKDLKAQKEERVKARSESNKGAEL